MSAKVRLAGKLPGDEPVNGLDRLADELCDRWLDRTPDAPAAVLVIGVMQVRKFETVDTDNGLQRVPLLTLSRVEVLGALGTEPLPHAQVATAEAQNLLLELAEARTGATPLPMMAEDGSGDFEVIEP